MDNTMSWWEAHRPSKRKLIQLYSALLYNAHLRGFIDGEIYQGKAKAVCVPGFNCYSCPGAVGACPLGSIQNALAYSGHRAGWYVLGIIMIFGLSLGRTICGWLCPLGLIQELLHKIPTPKIPKSRVTRALSYLKYVILAVFVVAVPMWYGVRHDLAVPGFCKYICPAGTFEGAIGLLSNPKNASYFSMLKILFTRKFVIMIIIGTTCIFCYRSFCRFICPLGAIYGLFNKLALISVKVDENRCNGCGACVRSCKMDVRHVGDHECINCAKCMGACNQNALSLRCGNHTLIAPACGCADDREDSAAKRAKNGKIGWGVALAVLCFALLWFNVLDPDLPKSQAADATVQTADAGAQAGEGAQAGDDAQVGDNAQASEGAQAAGETQAEGAQTAEGTPTGEAAAPGNTYASSAPIGIAIGNQLADFTAEKLDGTQFHLADTRGKVVILNMWATYCGPCVQELPVFESFQKTHADDVVVFIIHASDPLDDVPEFLAKKGIGLPCAIDSDDDRIYTLCGANPSILPHTVVLNRNGEITYNQTGSMTGALLDELFEKAK
ncbi:MAG: redoxin family protein [Lachnospiraceae bacterium]|nr:redoxin family protein [Lachnospiraceae bacterium]